jgi:hypothetical protein
MLVYGLSDSLKMGLRRQPDAGPDPRRILPYFAVSVVFAAVLVINLVVANLGLFLAGGLWNLGLPMTMSVLDEVKPGQHIGPGPVDDGPSVS